MKWPLSAYFENMKPYNIFSIYNQATKQLLLMCSILKNAI